MFYIWGGQIETERWHHLAFVYSSGQGEAILYLDGEAVATEAVQGEIIVPNQSLPLTIGTWYEQNQAFAGLLDELRVYNVALSPNEIRQLANRSGR